MQHVSTPLANLTQQ